MTVKNPGRQKEKEETTKSNRRETVTTPSVKAPKKTPPDTARASPPLCKKKMPSSESRQEVVDLDRPAALPGICASPSLYRKLGIDHHLVR